MPKRRLKDEAGCPCVRTGPGKVARDPLGATEIASYEEGVASLRRLAATTMTLTTQVEMGRIALDMEPSFWRHPWPGPTIFAEYLVQAIGEGSRQLWDRRIMVALVYSKETLSRCETAGVGFRMVADLAALDHRLRAALVNLTLLGVPSRAVEYLRRRFAGARLNWSEHDPAVMVQAAYERWRTDHAAARATSKEKRERLSAELDERHKRLMQWEQELKQREERLRTMEAAP